MSERSDRIEGTGTVPTAAVTPAAFQGFPLSPQQRRIRALAETGGDVGAWGAWGAILIEGPLDRTRLRAAVAAAVERHEILRTTYRRLPGMAEPLQVIGEAATAWEEAEGDGDRLDDFRESGAGGHPLRLRLARLSADRHLLFVALPALSADARTLENLVAEIAGAGPAEPMQYADYAAWHNEVLDSTDLESEAELWRREELAPLLARAVPGSGFSPAAVRLPADPKAAAAARALASGANLEAALLAVFQAVLARFTGQPRLAVGVRLHGRDFEELEGALGAFSRCLPVAAEVDGDASTADLVRAASRALLRVRERQEGFTWERLAAWSGAGGTLFPAWLFQLETPPRRYEAGGLAFSLAERRVVAERFELALSCTPGAKGLELEVLYDPARLDEETVRRLAGSFLELLRQAATSPGTALGELDMLPEAERRRALWEPNRTAAALPGAGLCLHQLMAERAAREPGRVAVRDDRRSMTWEELARAADRLALRLAAAGVRPEDRVAIRCERSVDMVVGLLGILRAGAAYVPLDPDHPRERLEIILEEARPVLVLERPLDDDSGRVGGTLPEIGPDHLAYVLYTSGSTGRPKGVMVTHRAIVNRLLWMQSVHPLGPDDRVLQKTPYGFDASIWEIFVPLFAGAELVLARPRGHQDSAYLAETAADQDITVLQLVPSQLRLFLDEPAVARCAALRRMFCGGEELTPDLARRFFQRFPAAELVNLYGPTEAAIDATSWPCRREALERVPIGPPIANIRVHLANRRLRPVPWGAPGELLIGGVGLARGYLGRPDLTAERFVPDPFGDHPGARLYRTGDLARRLPGGELEYLGRVDRQVKVRGVRIELREIETLLAAHPGVRHAVAVVRGEGPDRRLLAYVVPAEGASPSPEELRAFLSERLPAIMMPAGFAILRALPLTPSGKVDWNALPEPEPERPGPGSGDEPLTPTEQLLAGIWAEVLGCERVGRQDDFFARGGHSLAATQVVSRIRKTFGVEMRIQTLFGGPTVAALAVEVDAALRAGHGIAAPPIERASRDGDLPLSFAQQRLWFLEQLRPGTALYNIPDAVRFLGALDVRALAATLAEIVRRHESLRTSFPTVRGQAVQRIGLPVPLPLPVVDLTALPDERRDTEASLQVETEGGCPFDLARGPLLRVLLLRLRPEEHLAAFTVHHIVSDAWSTGLLVREVAALYGAFAAGEASPLPELPLQYADFAVWQRNWLQGEVLEGQLAWWRGRLSGAPERLDLPSDRPRPERPTLRGATRTVLLPAPLADALRALGRREGATLFMVVLAVFQLLLRHLSGRDDVVVGTDVANRNRAETEGLIGFFINQLALRTDLSGDPRFVDLLARVRDTALGAYAHQDVPFDLVVDTLKLERSLGWAPLFQVKLFLENTPGGALRLPGLEIVSHDVEVRVAKLDLVLALWERPEGLSGWINYSTDLFDEPRVARLVRQLTTLAAAVAAWPEAKLSTLLEVLAAMEKKEKDMEKASFKNFSFKKSKPAPVAAITLSGEDSLVERTFLAPGQTLPLVIQPRVPDVDLAEWAEANREAIEADLLRHGAILFRGFGIDTPEVLEPFARNICPDLFNENGEHPRESVSGNVYTPVFYPQDQQLLWHNENTFNWNWPRKIFFACAKPADEGGETPIVDSRRVYQELRPEIREQFETRGVRYQRNYTDGLGLPWRTVFQTDSREEVERECAEDRIDFEWRDGDRLRTRAVRPAVARHPVTGEMTWLNQAQHWHVSCLDPQTRDSMRSLFEDGDLPRQCHYGDGTPIEDAHMQEILDVYSRLEVSFPWRRGDVILLDNMLTAHGRNPYKGQRKILVAMGQMTDFGQI